MLRRMYLGFLAAALCIAAGATQASANGGRGCEQLASGQGKAPAYTSRYNGPAGYGHPRRPYWAAGAVYRSPQAYVVYEPPYAGYSRRCGYFYCGLGSTKWVSGR